MSMNVNLTIIISVGTRQCYLFFVQLCVRAINILYIIHLIFKIVLIIYIYIYDNVHI